MFFFADLLTAVNCNAPYFFNKTINETCLNVCSINETDLVPSIRELINAVGQYKSKLNSFVTVSYRLLITFMKKDTN
jgi:hypothetical protein